MPRASFSFGPSNAHTMEMDYRWWGQEAYFVDGKLLEKRWNMSFAGNRVFKIGNHTIRIEISVGPKEYFTRAYIDDKLHVPELFPEVKARVEKWKRPPRSNIVPALIGIVFLVIALWVSGIWKW